MKLENVPPQANEDDIKKCFSQYQVKSVLVRRDKNKKSLGNGFIEFASAQERKKAMQEVIQVSGAQIKLSPSL